MGAYLRRSDQQPAEPTGSRQTETPDTANRKTQALKHVSQCTAASVTWVDLFPGEFTENGNLIGTNYVLVIMCFFTEKGPEKTR
jgi:hypothetical protein